MIQKGKIEKVIDRYNYKVRIPKYDKVQEDAESTSTEDLATGIVCTTPGMDVAYTLGDIVIVSFENDEINRPIILGLLYRDNNINVDSDSSLVGVNEGLKELESSIDDIKNSSSVYTHIRYSNDNGVTFTSLYNPNTAERTDSSGNIYCIPVWSKRGINGIEIDKNSKFLTWFISDENNHDITNQIGIETIFLDSDGNVLRTIPKEEKSYTIQLNNLTDTEDKLYLTYKIYVPKNYLDTLHVSLGSDKNVLGTVEGKYLGICVSNSSVAPIQLSNYKWISFAAGGISNDVLEVISELEETTGEIKEQMTEVTTDVDGFRVSVAEAVTTSQRANDTAQSVRDAADRGDFDGVGVYSTEITYQESSSNTEVPIGTWYDEEHMPQVPDGHYLWTKTYITYTNDTHSTSYSVARQGVKGDTGETGLNVSNVLLYHRGSTAPTKPTGNLIYTFTTGDITLDPEDATSNLNGWTKNIPAIDGHPCWVISASVSANTPTTIIESGSWSTQVKFVEDGESGGIGAHGINTAPIYLYQRNSSTPIKPTNTLTYTFSTRTLSGTIDNNWVVDIGTLTGTDPIWVIGSVASSNTDSDTIGSNEWSTPIILSQDGNDGADGQDGSDGISISSVTNYYLATSLSSDVTPSTPGWTTTIQTMDSTNQYLWNYEVVTGSDNSIISTTTPVIIGRYGQDGNQGPSGIDGKGITSIIEWYQISNDNVNPPATPTSSGTGYESSPIPTTVSNPYLWNYEVINYTTGNPTITDARVIGTQGEDGQDGIDGLNQATVSIYKRSSTIPDTPEESGTYTFATGQLTGDVIDEEGWETSVPSGNNPCYVSTGLAISRGATATIDSWTDVVKFVENGTNGIDGYNQATLNLYQRSSQTPTQPSSGTSYNFNTKQISGTLGSWVTSIPTGTEPCWITSAAAISREQSVSLTWSFPIKLVQDGQAGLNQATVYLYKRGTSVTSPSSVRYRFSDGKLVDVNGNEIQSVNGWTRNIPTGSDQCWVVSASVVGREDIVIISSWSSPTRLVKDGTSATQYYTHIRYSANADGHDYVETPTSSTKYIGIYVGTSQDAPVYNDSGWKWNKYLGDNGQNGESVTVESIKYSVTNTDDEPSTWPYDSAPEVGEGQWLWSKVTFLPDYNTIISKSYSGTSGIDGLNQANIYLYKRSSSSPSKPSATNGIMYRFSDGSLSINGGSTWVDQIDGWTKTIPEVGTSGYPCWVTSASAISQETTDNIANNEWSGPNKISENGINQAVVRLYKRATTTPVDTAAKPNRNLTYTFSTSSLTPADQDGKYNGWSVEIPPSNNSKDPCWFISSVASGTGTTDTIYTSDWSSPIKLMNDGVGIVRIEEEYRLSTSDSVLVPSDTPTPSEQRYVWNTVQPAYVHWEYYWIRQHIYYDNGTDSYSTPTYSASITGAVNYVETHYLSTSDFSVEKDHIQSRVARTELELIGQYALSQTSENTSAKVATITPTTSDWQLEVNKEITVQFEYSNTTSNPTLNINGTGAKPIKDSNGDAVTEWEAGSIFLFKYNGTNWVLQNDLKFERLNKAESRITQNANNIELKVSEDDFNGNNIVSKINLNSTSATIAAERVNISGATIFTSGRLSENYLNNAYDAIGSADTAKDEAIAAAAQDAADKAASAVNTANSYTDGAVSDVADDLTDLSNNLITYQSDTNSAITALQDGQIEIWYKIVDPTLTNEPASTWTTTAEKDRHLDDLYYNTETGHSWRWKKDGSVYSWQQIPIDDSAANIALEAAQGAAELAGKKKRIFVSQPTPPYETGDLWVDGNVVKYCKNNIKREEGSSYVASDWTETANKVTDLQQLSDTTNIITNAVNSGVATTVKSVSVKNEYRLSTSTTQLLPKNSQLDKYDWRTTIPTWETGNYIWNRVKTTYTYVNNNSTDIYTPGTQQNEYGVYDSQLTTALSTAHDAQNSANSAANTVVTTQEYRLSDSDRSLSGSGDGYTYSPTMPVWVEDTYIWTRFHIERTTVGNPSTRVHVSYTPSETGICDKNLTTALSTSVSTIFRQQTLYLRTQDTTTTPTISNTWLETSGSGYDIDNWSLSIPSLSYNGNNYPYLWEVTQTQTVSQYNSNQCSCSNVVLDNSIGSLSNQISEEYSLKVNTVVRSQRIYFQQHEHEASSSIVPPSYPEDWIELPDDPYLEEYDTWTVRRMPYNREYPYTWCCEQMLYDDDTISYTDISLDDTITVIDGGKIITNSITADQLDTGSVNTKHLSIQDYITFDVIPTPITDDSPPNFVEGTFGSYNELTDIYEKLTQQPSDWQTNWRSYYTYEETIPYMILGQKGIADKFAITMNDKQIAFWEDQEKVAYITGRMMSIPKSVMLKEMNIGQQKWSWREHNSNLELKWIGDV